MPKLLVTGLGIEAVLECPVSGGEQTGHLPDVGFGGLGRYRRHGRYIRHTGIAQGGDATLDVVRGRDEGRRGDSGQLSG